MIEQDLQKRLVGQEILQGSDLLDEIHKVKQNNEQLIIELNTKYHSKKEVINISVTSLENQSIHQSMSHFLFIATSGNILLLGKISLSI